MRCYFSCLLLFLFSIGTSAQSGRDTVSYSDQLTEAVIIDDLKVKETRTMVSIKPIQIKKYPALFGESDVLKTIQLYPGVHSGSEGDVGLSIRGGNYDETLITLDGTPIFNPGHLKGFVSAVSPFSTENVDVIRGGFPAKYGTRLSGVVDIRSRYGNLDKYYGSVTIGTLSSAIGAGGYLGSNTSFNLNVRGSYLGLVVLPVYNHIGKSNNSNDMLVQLDGVNFYDANLSVYHRFNRDNELFGTFYIGRDNAKSEYSYDNVRSNIVSGMMGESWGNTLGTINWKSKIFKDGEINTSLRFSNYLNNNEILENSLDSSDEKSIKSYTENNESYDINEISISSDVQIDKEAHKINFGVIYSLNYLSQRTEIKHYKSVLEDEKNVLIDEYSTLGDSTLMHIPSVYCEDEMTIAQNLNLALGVRLSLYSADGSLKFSPEPRIRLSYSPSGYKRISLKGSFSVMSQGLHQLTRGNIVKPGDMWVSMDENIPIMHSYTYDMAMFWNPSINKQVISFGVQAYFRTLSNLLEFRPGSSFLGVKDIDDILVNGDGMGYGLEFIAEKKSGKTTGMLSYTWSKMLNRFDPINDGEWFLSKNDCRNSLSLVVSRQLGKNFDVTASFVYKTGKLVTIEDVYLTSYSENHWESETLGVLSRNNIRLPDYHKLDISANYHIFHKRGKSTINLTVNNAYNRHNSYMLRLVEGKLKSICIFPIFPSLSYSYEF